MTMASIRPIDADNLKAVVTVVSVACDGDTASMIGVLAGAIAVIAGSSNDPDKILLATIDSIESARKIFNRYETCPGGGSGSCSCHPRARQEPS